MLELVVWRDAHFEMDPTIEDENEDYLCESVGWVSEAGRWLRVDSEHTPEGPRGITRIPVENVVARKPLFPGPSACGP